MTTNTVEIVAWALFAGDHATYSGGQYVPDENELHLARLFLESIEERGYEVVRKA